MQPAEQEKLFINHISDKKNKEYAKHKGLLKQLQENK